MSYTFLLEQGEESSAECFSDIPVFALSNGTSTLDNAYLPASGTDVCHASQYGTTFKPLMDALGGGALMSSVEDSLAKTLVLPEKEQESTENAPACGITWPESLAKFDPDTFSWRTRQCLLFEDSGECLETWPQWGMMRNGVCWERSISEHRIAETGCGYWATPQASDNRKCVSTFGSTLRNRKNIPELGTENGWINPELSEWLMGWPTNWTDLQGAVTAKFQQWRLWHSRFFPLV